MAWEDVALPTGAGGRHHATGPGTLERVKVMHPPRPLPTRIAPSARAAALGAAALGALAALTGVAPVAGAAATPTTNAQAEYQAALKAVGRQGVHFSSTASQNGVDIAVSGDTGASSGMEQLVVHSGSLTERMAALVVGATGYVRGNRAALEHVIGLSSAQSSRYANTWLSFPTSQNGLDELVTGLLNSQVSSELEMSGPYRYGADTTVGGRSALSIHGYETTQGGGKVTTILYVPATGAPLPLKEVTNPGDSGGNGAIHGTVVFSNWGQHITERAPAHSVSLLKLVPTSSASATTTTKG